MPLRWFKPFTRLHSTADAENLEDAWSVDDDGGPDDRDGVSFFPRLSLVTYQDDEPTWCLPVDTNHRETNSTLSCQSRANHHELVAPRISTLGREIRHCDDSNLPNCRGEFLDGGQDSAEHAWKSLHCHLDANLNHEDQTRAQKQLIWACILCLVFMMGEAIGGYLSNSLAIMTDAAHLMSDFASFLISLFAIWLAKQKPSKRMSFGYYRAEALGALTSIVIIWIVSGVLVYMAVLRLLRGTYKLEPDTMLIVAAIGVLINIILGVVLHGVCHAVPHHHHHHHHNHNHERVTSHAELKPDDADGLDSVVRNPTNINVRAAFIHVVGDLVQSLGVLIAAFVIRYKPEWKVADPICTFLFSGLVILTTIGVLKDTILVLLESTPKLAIDASVVRRDLTSVPGVQTLHDFHLWSLTVGKHAFAGHVAVDDEIDTEDILQKLTYTLRHRHPSIISSTIQVERRRREDCKFCSP